jgi:hypothetical protein
MTPEEKFETLDKLGETAVRCKLATLEWQGTEANIANAWLEQRAATQTRRVANRAQVIAIIAIIMSCIATLAAAYIKSK